MKRRELLKTALAIPLWDVMLGRRTWASIGKDPGMNGQLRSRVRPGEPGWPAPAEWSRLKEQVGANLLEAHPLFGSCTADPNGTACRDALKNIGNPYWIGDQPAGTEVSGWLGAWTPAPSAYALRARSAQDVAAGIRFARDRNLRLVVKGGGHSYLGTSNAPDSLAIWTRALNQVSVHDAFVPKGCEARIAPVPAVSAGAGAVWMDLYNTVTTQGGRYVQGGGCTTVGVAGHVQSGGFGSFSKGFGTAAAGLLEAEVVTADGEIRIVNPCSDPDLFWALKGGGGGTFGVITRVTLRTHDLPKLFGGAGAKIKARSDAAFEGLIERFISFYAESLFNPHWGEQVKLGPDNVLEISMVSQGLEHPEEDRVWKPFFDWVRGSHDLSDRSVSPPVRPPFTYVGPAQHWWEVEGNPSMIRDTRGGAPEHHGWWQGDQEQVGAFLHSFDSLWLPASLLRKDRQGQLAAALFAASRHQQVQLHINKGLAGAPAEVLAAMRETATNPVAVEAFALVIIAGAEAPAYPGLVHPAIDLVAAQRDANAIDLAAAALRKIVPNAGSYVSESNFFNGSWQQEYWGQNYPRLRAIKRQYDPDGLFIVHHGVGSEDWSADGFTRV
jgi:FAD/FMN-containing dehydrogenase